MVFEENDGASNMWDGNPDPLMFQVHMTIDNNLGCINYPL